MEKGLTRARNRVYLSFIDFTRKHPRLSRVALALIGSVPGLRDSLPVTTRILLGGKALDCFDVDLERGMISLGGLDWRIHGSEYIEITHRVLGQRMGTQKAREVIYKIAFRCMEESLQRLDYERLFPSFVIPLLRTPMGHIRWGGDDVTHRLYREIEYMLLRLSFSELGWGCPESDAFPVPSRVSLKHSVEAYWISRSRDPYWEGLRKEPVCYAFAGMVAGFLSHLTGERHEVNEEKCAVAGAPCCVFAVRKAEE